MALKLEDVEAEVFSDFGFDPVQPEETDKVRELRELMKVDVYDNFVAKYGGENYAYARFLAARNNNVKKAEKMMKQCIKYRVERNLDGKQSEEELTEAEEMREQVKSHWFVKFWGYTNDGHMLTYASVKNVVLKDLLEIPEDRIKAFYLEQLDRAFTMQNYMNTAPRRDPEDKAWKGSVDIINLKGISMSHLHIRGLNLLNRVLKIAQLVAPEIMDKTYIINAPWFFSAAWSIIKKVLAPEIVAKVTITSGDAKDELLKLVTPEQLEDILSSFD